MAELVSLLIARRNAIASIEVDATVQERHSRTSMVTEHEVEDGADVVDHVRRQPDGLELRVVLADHPMGYVDRIGAALEAGPEGLILPERSRELWRELEALHAAGQPITVTTALQAYEDMVVEALDTTVTPATGGAIVAAVALRQIRRVTSRTVEAPETSVSKAKPVSDRGRQPATPSKRQSISAEPVGSFLDSISRPVP